MSHELATREVRRTARVDRSGLYVVSRSSFPISVVVSTYDWPEALDLVLRVLAEEKSQGFQVVVADDGSGAKTAETVSSWGGQFAHGVKHVWQPDAGFRKSRIWNLALRQARGDYVVLIDGDSLPRRGFLAATLRAALPGWMLASKRLNLSPSLSRRVLEDRVPVWRWSAAEWVARAPRELFVAYRETASPGLLVPLRDRRRPWRQNQREFTPPYNGYGFFMGVWRQDLERVNGFDMRYEGWGGEDVDLGVRLRRAGVRCGWPGPRTTMLHLWHAPRKGLTKSNTPLEEETRRSNRIEALEGLRELETQLKDSSGPASSGSHSESGDTGAAHG